MRVGRVEVGPAPAASKGFEREEDPSAGLALTEPKEPRHNAGDAAERGVQGRVAARVLNVVARGAAGKDRAAR
jgi:hypothetical protein